MLKGFFWLMLFLVIGNSLQGVARLPIAGSVLGMLLLLAVLILRGRVSLPLAQTAQGLIQYFSLLLLPSAAGVMFMGHELAPIWWPLTVAIAGGTVISICTTLLVMRAMINWQEKRHSRRGDSAPSPSSEASGT